ncbi:MAG TPA: outer membrane beta-barrel protein [Gemmatimonadales bacterium]|nr:outer membrane beta-barrel protein [Gemmatimonadales bacterium]
MSPLTSRSVWLFAISVLIGSFSPASAQTQVATQPKDTTKSKPADTTTAPAPAAAAAAPTTFPLGIKLGGFGEASYVYSNNAAEGVIVGRLYDRYSQSFSLNGIEFIADRPYATNKVDAGVHSNFIIGQNAAVLYSTGLQIGQNIDITQLFVTLNLPTANGNGIQFKFGKMVTLMGLEVIETTANPNWSLGNQFIYLENFTSTGIEMDYKASGAVSFAIRLDNGWDRVVDTTGHKSVMGSLALSGKNTTLNLVPYYGPEQDGSSAARYGIDALFNQKIGSKTSVWIQGDYGTEKANYALPDSTKDATWWGIGGWIAQDLSPTLNLALRGDYISDNQGARTAGAFGLTSVFTPGFPYEAHVLWSATGTLNVKTFPNVLLRPEVRYDHSKFQVFNGEFEQFSVAFSAAYSF